MTFRGVPWYSIPSIQSYRFSRTCINHGFFDLHYLKIPCKDRIQLRVSYCTSIVSPFGRMFNYRHVKSCTTISVVTYFPVLLTSSPNLLMLLMMWNSAPWVPDAKCYFRMMLVLFCRHSHFPPCVLAMQGNLTRQELVLHYLSSCLVPMPPFRGLKIQETSDPSDLFSSSPLLVSSLVMTLRYTQPLIIPET